MDYDLMAHIAKFGGTIFFVLFFLTVLVYVFAPGGKKRARDAANVVMTDDDTPITDKTSDETSESETLS